MVYTLSFSSHWTCEYLKSCENSQARDIFTSCDLTYEHFNLHVKSDVKL